MRINDFVLLAYQAFGDFTGKTSFQKKIYFLGVITGKVDFLGYKPHYYGPYSAEVEMANAELKSLGYISENVSSWGIDDNGFEKVRYDYHLSEEGKTIADKKVKEFHEEWGKIATAAKIIKKGGNIDYYSLSVAAKAFFILSNKDRPLTLKEIKETASQFGWNIEDDVLDKAVNFLKKTEQIKTKKQTKS
jgi:uncharacterized protein YwgA